MKVTVKRKKNVGAMKQSSYGSVGVKKPVSCNSRQRSYHAAARTQVIPRRAKRGA